MAADGPGSTVVPTEMGRAPALADWLRQQTTGVRPAAESTPG